MFSGAGRRGLHRCGPLASVGFAVEDGGGEFLGRFGQRLLSRWNGLRCWICRGFGYGCAPRLESNCPVSALTRTPELFPLRWTHFNFNASLWGYRFRR